MIERVVNFVGGAKDGTSGKIQCPDKHYVPPVLYYAKPLSLKESAALDIDGVIKYRGPDEVYQLESRLGGVVYRLSHIVNYDPRAGIKCEAQQ